MGQSGKAHSCTITYLLVGLGKTFQVGVHFLHVVSIPNQVKRHIRNGYIPLTQPHSASHPLQEIIDLVGVVALEHLSKRCTLNTSGS